MNLGTALVTGGASGMGLAIVERLARDGFRVVMADRNAELAEKEAEALRAQGLDVEHRVVDLTDEAATRALARSLAPLAALVNNAGLFDERKFFEVDSADYRRAFDVNLLAVATLTQEAARDMAPGAIVNIASRAYLGAKNHPHYVASKAALVGYTRASAMELAPRGILVNAIAPGLIAALAQPHARTPCGATGPAAHRPRGPAARHRLCRVLPGRAAHEIGRASW